MLRIVVAFATAVGLLFLRFKVIGSTLPVFTNFDNPASHEAAPAKQVGSQESFRVVHGTIILGHCDKSLIVLL